MALAITEPVAETIDSSDGATYALGAFTPSANALLVVMVFATATVLASPTMSGGSLTWTMQTRITYNTGDSAVLFTAPTGGSPASCTATVDFTGDNANGCVMMIFQVTGTSLSVTQMDSEARTGANPVITPPAALTTGNCYMAGFGMPRNPPTSTPPTSWTEIADGGHSIPPSGASGAYRVNGESGTTITFTSNSAAYGILMCEVQENAAPGTPLHLTLMGCGT